MKNRFTRTITLTGAVVSHGAPLDDETLSELKAESIKRLQAELGSLVDQKFSSGSLSHLDGNASVSLDWKIEVQDLQPGQVTRPEHRH